MANPTPNCRCRRLYTLAPGVMQASNEITIPTTFTDVKWVKAVDLMPGVTSMVRRAYISIEGGPILQVWEPGDDVVEPPSGAAFKLPAGAKLHLKVDYKKSWQDEQKALADKSTVGLYFTEEPLSGKSIESVTIDGPKGEGDAPAKSFSGTLKTGGRIVALRPMLDSPYALVEVTAVGASGRKVPLLKLRNTRPEWPRRYWLVGSDRTAREHEDRGHARAGRSRHRVRSARLRRSRCRSASTSCRNSLTWGGDLQTRRRGRV